MSKLEYQAKGLCYITGKKCLKRFKCEECELEKREREIAQAIIEFFD